MLAIDTSADQVGLALSRVTRWAVSQSSEISWSAPRKQTETLLNQIDHLLRINEIEVNALGGVAVAIGPGSFNALRVGLSTAKALCFGLDIPIFGIGTLDASAHAFRSFGFPIRAFIDAGRNRVVASDYRIVNEEAELLSEPAHRRLDQLGEGLLEPTLLIGRLPEAVVRNLEKLPNVIIPDEASRTARTGIIINMALCRWRNGDEDNLFQLEPIYVHTRSGGQVKA